MGGGWGDQSAGWLASVGVLKFKGSIPVHSRQQSRPSREASQEKTALLC